MVCCSMLDVTEFSVQTLLRINVAFVVATVQAVKQFMASSMLIWRMMETVS